MPPERSASVKAPSSLSSNVIWPPLATWAKVMPMMSDHRPALAGKFCPAAVSARQVDVMMPPWVTLKWWRSPGPQYRGEMHGDLVVGGDRRRRVEVDGKLVGAALVIVESADVDVIGARRGRREDEPGIAQHAGADVVVLGEHGPAGIEDADDGSSRSARRAVIVIFWPGGQIDPEPVVIAIDLEDVIGCAADGDACSC